MYWEQKSMTVDGEKLKPIYNYRGMYLGFAWVDDVPFLETDGVMVYNKDENYRVFYYRALRAPETKKFIDLLVEMRKTNPEWLEEYMKNELYEVYPHEDKEDLRFKFNWEVLGE